MTLIHRVQYHAGAERPALKLWLYDDDGTLIDFSVGYTWSLKVGVTDTTALLTKTAGIVGAVGAGTEPTGTPNVVVTWIAGELALTAGAYRAQLTATSSGVDRIFEFPFDVLAVIT